MVVSNAFSKNLKALRDKKDITQQQLADMIEVRQNTVSAWETRGKKPRSKDIVDALCAVFDCTEKDLFGFGDGFYAKMYGLSVPPHVEETAYLPLRGRVHAGSPQDEEESEPVLVPLPQSIADAHKNGFFLLVEGDCMDKVYPEGCHVLVDPDISPLNGAVAAVLMDTGEYVMRRIYKGVSAVILSPDSHSAEHKDIVIDGDRELHLVGTVVWFQGEIQ